MQAGRGRGDDRDACRRDREEGRARWCRRGLRRRGPAAIAPAARGGRGRARGRRRRGRDLAGSPRASPARTPTAVPVDPACVEDEAGAEEEPAVEAAVLAAGHRPGLVDDQLRLEQPANGPADEDRRHRDADRGVAGVQERRGDDGRDDAAAGAEDRRCRELCRAGERRRRHDDRLERADARRRARGRRTRRANANAATPIGAIFLAPSR